MRLHSCLIAVLLVFTAVSCKEDIQITFIESGFNTDIYENVHINVPIASGNVSVSEKINLAIETHVSLVFQIGESKNVVVRSIKESIDDFTKEFNNFKEDFPENPEEWEAQIDGEIIFQSSRIITLAITSYVNTGGANGLLNISLLNFNAQTGEEIENNKLFEDAEGFKNIAKTYFEKETVNKDLLDSPEGFKLPENIGYNNEGVILIYNTYEVAPYSTGIIEFIIPFEKVKYNLVF